ncbi:MAG TPA: M1 family metallopeptidase [Gammaproteobacteria bacterium]|nr:M1 family metallopeptidase [Gammaproteobacteria bacterium]
MRLSRIVLLMAACGALAACGNQHSSSQQQTAQADRPSASTSQQGVPTGRLPTDVQPLAYNIDFTMDPDKAYFTAHEVLTVDLKQPTDTIWFHSQNIDIKSIKLALENGKSLNLRFRQVNDDGVAKLSLPKTVQPQKARIVIDFKNPYSPGLLGAYKVKDDGNNYIFTQFEAIAARRAFPSFDEPAFKTPYTYSFTVPSSDKVVANTPVESKTDAGNGMVKWQFMTTKPLPTYLVAWAVGPLDIVQGPSIPANDLRDHPVPVYGVTVKGKGDQIQYAIDHAGEIVQAEEKYYGIGYPWKKLSLIAVPDFSAGAMENAGAITFRDVLLLMDPKTAPTWQKRAYWSVAAHELGHMWTGDLVTVPWWNDIWLNEAFATWMEQKIMVELHPDWNPKMDILNTRQGAMHADSLVSARAIRQPIKNTGDIKNAFDGITYSKGAAVISMFENYVGPDKFRAGMHNYLEENAYGSASLDDFLNAISKAAGKNIGPAFKTFLNQPGLPMVEATLKMDNGKPTVHLVQSRYLPVGSSGNPQAEHWDIPVCMRYPVDGHATQQCYMLTQHSADVTLNGDKLPTWFMPNTEGVGYYQWSLGDTGYAELTKSLDQLTPVGQMSLAGSIEAAFDAGKINTIQAMKALAPLAHSKNEPVAEEPMSLLRYAHEWLVSGKTKDALEAYAQKLYGQYDVAGDFKKGGAPDDANQREFEAKVAAFLADTGRDQQVRQAADDAAARLLGLGNNSKPDLTAVASDFIPVALTVAVQDKGKPVFDALDQVYRHAQNPMVRGVALQAMASATDPQLAARIRAMSLDSNVVRQNEVMRIWLGQISQPETREATWQWFKKNFKQAVARVSADHMGRLPMIAEAFCSDKKAEEVKNFLAPRLAKYPATHRAMAQAMEAAHLCAARRKAQSPSAEKFFSQQ